MIQINSIDQLRIDLSVKAKNGVDFIFAASVIWSAIAFIYTTDNDNYSKAVYTFTISGFLLPTAFLFSKVFKTQWKLKENKLQPLGLWLNFAQLFYFPFLIFVLVKSPDSFLMTYMIITGAHFFPYAWYYKTNIYAIAAGIISFGSMLVSLLMPGLPVAWLAVAMSGILFALGILLYIQFRKRLIGSPL